MTATTSKDLNALRILIVDNDKTTATILGDLLSSKGLWVKTVFDANEGLLVLIEEDVDVALIDINLGENAMSGLDLVKEYKSNVPETRVRSIAVTGYNLDDIDENLKSAGFDDYLAKPFKLADVLEKLMIQRIE